VAPVRGWLYPRGDGYKPQWNGCDSAEVAKARQGPSKGVQALALKRKAAIGNRCYKMGAIYPTESFSLQLDLANQICST